MSTSRDLYQATKFAHNGLILVLCKYHNYGVFKFDCDRLSAFSHEKETLFFGGRTVLRIFSIRQYIGKWISYKKYMEPMRIIHSMIHGLHFTADDMGNNDDNQINEMMAYHLMQHMLCVFNSQPSSIEVPLYVKRLWNHYTSNAIISINVLQSMNDCKWIKPLFMRASELNPSELLLHVVRICKIFNKVIQLCL
eukprot:267313_1